MKKYISINITNNCNLNCKYCYENFKEKKNISIRILDEILSKELNYVSNSDEYESIEIQPFGGEPFLNFDAIKHITTYVRNNPIDKEVVIYIITNGTLVHGEIQKWLVENKDLVHCGLSLDGTRDMHNLNRCNSYDRIDVNFFIKNYPLQPVKMTIAPNTISRLAEGVIHCHELGFLVNCNLCYGVDWSDPSIIDTLNHELETLVGYYLRNSKVIPCSMLNQFISARTESEFCKKWCGVGTGTFSYNLDGVKYPCQYFMPISIGEKSEDVCNIVFLDSFPRSDLNNECNRCTLEPSCPTCYGQNFLDTNNIYHRDMRRCHLMKAIIKARCYLMIEEWKAGTIKYCESEQSEILDSIIKIYNSGDLNI